MDTKKDTDNLDNALKIMNNLFQLTEEFVNDTPDNGNQSKPNTSLDSFTSSKPSESTVPELKFPELPDPDKFFESIVTNSKTTSESSISGKETSLICDSADEKDNSPITSSSIATCSKTIKAGPVLYPKASSFGPNKTAPENTSSSIPASSTQPVSNVHQPTFTGEAGSPPSVNINQAAVEFQAISHPNKGFVKTPVSDTPIGSLQSELEKVKKTSEINAIINKYSMYSDELQLMISKKLAPNAFVPTTLPFVNLQKNNMIVNFINKIKTGKDDKDEAKTSEIPADPKQTSDEEFKSGTQNVSSKSKNAAKTKKKISKTGPKTKTNSKTGKKALKPILNEEGEVMITENQLKAIQNEPTLFKRRVLVAGFIRNNTPNLRETPLINRKRLMKLSIKSLLHVDVESIEKAKEELQFYTLKMAKKKKIKKVKTISSGTTPSHANETSEDTMKMNKNKTKGEKTIPVDIQSDTNDVENGKTEQNKECGLLGDSNKDNMSKKDDNCGTNTELRTESKDVSNISDSKATHSPNLTDVKANENTIDDEPVQIQEDEDDEIIVLEVPIKEFPLIDILSDDEDVSNSMKQDKTDQEEVMEITVDSELRKSIDQGGISTVELEENKGYSECNQLALAANTSTIEEEQRMNGHLERNTKGDHQLETLNPLEISEGCDFDDNNKVKDLSDNKVPDANSLKRKNEEDDRNENGGKKRKDTENNKKVEDSQGDGTLTGNAIHLMSAQSRIQDSAILSLINEVKMSTRQQRKQESGPSTSSHDNQPSKPSIRDRLGDKLSIKDRIGPIDSSSGASSRLPSGGSRIRDRLGEKVLDDGDNGEGDGLAIRVQIENELVTSETDMELGVGTAACLRHNADEDDLPFIRQVLIEPSNALTETDVTDEQTRTHAQSRFLSPNRLEDPSSQPEADFPMFNEAGDGFQTLSEAESEERGGGSESGRRRKRRSAKDRLGRRVDSSEEEDRRSPSSRRDHHHHRRHSGSSRHRSHSPRDRDSRPYTHVSRYKLVRNPATRVSPGSIRDRSRESPPRRDRSLESPSGLESSLERRRKSLERREKSLERREKERKNRHRTEQARARLTRKERSKYKWSDEEKKEMDVTTRSRNNLDERSRSPRNVQPRNVDRTRWNGPAQPLPPAPHSNLIDLTGQPPSMGYGTPFGPIMEHQIPPNFLDHSTMPMQDMSQHPPNLMPLQPFPMAPYNQPPPLYSQPPPNLMQPPVMPPYGQPPTFMPQAPNFPPSVPPQMSLPPMTGVPPPMVPQPSGTADPTDANFTYAFIEQNISKVKANLMNKIDTSKSKVDEYFEKWKVNEPHKDSGSRRNQHGARKSPGKKYSHERKRSNSSEIRSVSPENRSTSARSRSRSRLRRSQGSHDLRSLNRDTRSPESEMKTSRQLLEKRDSSSMGSLQRQASSSPNDVESRPTSPLNDREIDLLYRDLVRRRTEDSRRPPSIVSLSPSPPLELGTRFRGLSPSLLEQNRPSRLDIRDRSLLEHRESREKLSRTSEQRQRSSHSINLSISDLLSTARRCQQLSSRSPDLFTAPPANRPPLARSPPLIRPRTPPPPSPPRYDRLPRPARVQINLSPLRFSRSPSLEIDPRRRLDARSDMELRQPSSRRPLRLSPPALRWSQSPSPPRPSSRERVWYSRSPEPSQGRQRFSPGREEDFRADPRRFDANEPRRFHGNRDETLQLPPGDARHIILSRDEKSMSFSISPSPERRRSRDARSSSSDFVNPLDLVQNPGIPGEDDYP